MVALINDLLTYLLTYINRRHTLKPKLAAVEFRLLFNAVFALCVVHVYQ